MLKIVLTVFIVFVLWLVLYKSKTPNKIEHCPKFFKHAIEKSRYKSIYAKLLFSCKQKGVSLEPFYKTGLGHLLTISGLHITSLILLLYFIVSMFIRLFVKTHIPIFYFSLPIGILSSFMYVYYIGIEVPRLRALIMFLFGFLSFLYKGFKNKLLVILLSVVFIVILFPSSIYSASFYFSYTAVLAIYLSRKHSLVFTSFLIFLFMIPLNLYFNGAINFTSILANVIFIPIFSLVYYPVLLLNLPLIFFFRFTGFVDLTSSVFYYVLKLFSILSENTTWFVGYLSLNETVLLYIVIILVFIFFKYYDIKLLMYGSAILFVVFLGVPKVKHRILVLHNYLNLKSAFTVSKELRRNNVDILLIRDKSSLKALKLIVERTKIKQIITSYKMAMYCLKNRDFLFTKRFVRILILSKDILRRYDNKLIVEV